MRSSATQPCYIRRRVATYQNARRYSDTMVCYMAARAVIATGGHREAGRRARRAARCFRAGVLRALNGGAPRAVYSLPRRVSPGCAANRLRLPILRLWRARRHGANARLPLLVQRAGSRRRARRLSRQRRARPACVRHRYDVTVRLSRSRYNVPELSPRASFKPGIQRLSHVPPLQACTERADAVASPRRCRTSHAALRVHERGARLLE